MRDFDNGKMMRRYIDLIVWGIEDVDYSDSTGARDYQIAILGLEVRILHAS